MSPASSYLDAPTVVTVAHAWPASPVPPPIGSEGLRLRRRRLPRRRAAPRRTARGSSTWRSASDEEELGGHHARDEVVEGAVDPFELQPAEIIEDPEATCSWSSGWNRWRLVVFCFALAGTVAATAYNVKVFWYESGLHHRLALAERGEFVGHRRVRRRPRSHLAHPAHPVRAPSGPRPSMEAPRMATVNREPPAVVPRRRTPPGPTFRGRSPGDPGVTATSTRWWRTSRVDAGRTVVPSSASQASPCLPETAKHRVVLSVGDHEGHRARSFVSGQGGAPGGVVRGAQLPAPAPAQRRDRRGCWCGWRTPTTPGVLLLDPQHRAASIRVTLARNAVVISESKSAAASRRCQERQRQRERSSGPRLRSW